MTAQEPFAYAYAPCPVCRQASGQPCKTAQGNQAHGPHKRRMGTQDVVLSVAQSQKRYERGRKTPILFNGGGWNRQRATLSPEDIVYVGWHNRALSGEHTWVICDVGFLNARGQISRGGVPWVIARCSLRGCDAQARVRGSAIGDLI